MEIPTSKLKFDYDDNGELKSVELEIENSGYIRLEKYIEDVWILKFMNDGYMHFSFRVKLEKF